MSSNASRYCRSESSALTAFSRRSHAAALGRRMPWRSPMVTGVEDHVSTACGPLTVSRASDEVTNSAPPVTGSVWDRLRLRAAFVWSWRSEEHTSELQSRSDLVCRLLLEKKKN